MIAKTANLISKYSGALHSLYGERLAKLILFGSYARGDQNEASDMDFLIVLKDNKISALTEIEKINDQVYDLMIEDGIIVSFIPTTYEKFMNSPNVLYTRIKKEGMEL